MASPLSNSVFASILSRMPAENQRPLAIMGGISGSAFSHHVEFAELPLVIFDFETTGLDSRNDRIIEIGAVKFVNRQEVERMSLLVNPGKMVSEEITRITGITNEMLKDSPRIEAVMDKFHDFLRGCVGVAHNAEFDCAFLAHESARLGISCSYTMVCTLKMARSLVKCERKNLDALAAHYNLQFESRHRSIGDILVTAQVLWAMMNENPGLKCLGDLKEYQEEMVKLV